MITTTNNAMYTRWENYNNLTKAKYANFDDYLSCFKSKRRVQIKSERRKVYVDQVSSPVASWPREGGKYMLSIS